jgi:hypothetical protein
MNNNNNFFGDDDHACLPEPLDYRLRVATKRTDLPDDVIRLLSEAYYELCLVKDTANMLRDHRDSLLSTNEELEARIDSLKEGFEGGCHLCEVIGERNQLLRESNKAAWAANEELEKKNAELTEQRDEARRMVCFDEAAVLSYGENGVPYHPSVAHKIAEDRRWDCFKEVRDE